MKKVLLLLFLFHAHFFTAQVGINTTNPHAQLDIQSTSQAAPSNTDGILIPKMDVFPTINPTSAQQGMLVYLTTATTFSGNPKPIGFYYWNDSPADWIAVKGTDGGTLDQAYDFGSAGAGSTITADAGAVLINGTDGLVSTGILGSGVVAPSGAGTRMVWNPRKAAFRAGTITGTSWDDSSIGFGSVAFTSSTASGTNSFAAAGGIATGQSSFAFGTAATVSGGSQDAIAIGIGCQASNFRAVSIGAGNNASGGSSVAIGSSNTSSGSQAIALGISSNAVGSNSMALGRQNTSSSFGETVLGIGATTYTSSISGDTQFRTANATDRLFVVGNAIDANNNNTVDVSERSDALVVLKNGNVGIGSSTPQDKLHIVGNLRIEDGNQAAGKVLSSDANGTATWQNASANAWGVVGNSGTNATTNFIGTTDDTDLVLRTNNNDNFRIKNDGRIEIGNKGTNPTYSGASSLSKKLLVASEGIDNNIVFQTSNNSSDPVSVFFGVSRGTTAAPTIVNSGQVIAFNFFSGYDGAKFVPAAMISAKIDGVPVLNKMPGSLHFSTTPVSGASLIERMTIKNSGNVGIGTTNPLDQLHVVGNIRMVDGNQATGKVLTSDANGKAAWQNASDNAWGLTGNLGTGAATNFIGTSDDVDVVFKRNAVRSGLFGTTNSAFGVNALNVASTGTNNTAIGAETLQINTTGSNNTAIGFNAMATINQGSNNTGIGVDTATTSTLTTNATAIGYKATVGGSNCVVLGSVNGINGATSSVNVGIGTISPATALEVVDTNVITSATVEGTINVMTNGPQAIDAGGSITLGGTFTDAGTTFRTFGSIEARKANATTNSSSGYLILKTNNAAILAERMRITSLGDVGIGTATPGGQFELSLNEGRKPTSNTWTIPSDARLKNVNGIYEKGLAEILRLRPIRYNYKNTDKKSFDIKVLEKEAYGFLAQEVQPLFPEAVGTDPDGYLNFDLHPILIASVNAFKELNAKNDVLQKENEALKASVEAMNQKVEAILVAIEKLKK